MSDAGSPEDSLDAGAPFMRGEHRLPVLGTLVVALVLPILMPENFTIGPRWLLPTVGGALLLAMAITDPGRIDARSRQVRGLRIALIVVLVGSTAFATARLLKDLVQGSSITNSASPLLRAGGLVWLQLVIVFAFLYWELDGGGPGRRAHEPPKYVDLAFPEQLNPHIAPPGWRPVFFDYLYLGFTNATAFSPTDVMPLAHWAKFTMALQSLTSLVILGLVVARAVNILQ